MQKDGSTRELSLRDFSLRIRMLGTFALLFVVTVGGFAGAWSLLRSQHRQGAAVINEAGRQRMRIQKMVTLAHRIARGEEEKREELRSVAAQFERTLTAFQNGGSDQRLPAAPPRLQPQVRAVRGEWDQFRSSVEVIAERTPSSTVFQEALADLQRQSEVLLSEADQTVREYQTAHEQKVEKIERFLVGLAVLFVVLAGLSLFFAERHVVRPLARLRKEAAAIAEGDLDREVPAVDTQDEIGALTRSIREMKDRLVRALRETRIFRTAVEHAGHSIYWTDPEGTIEHVNPAFEEITGHSREEAVGATPRILQSGEHDEAFYEDLWSTIKEGNVWKGEIIDQRPNGEQFVMNQTIAPIEDGDGKIEHFIVVGTDVTEKKEYERALQEERDRFATLFENLPTPVVRCEVREEGTLVTAANPAFEETFGIESSAAEGQDIDELLVPDDRRAEASRIDRLALKEGTLRTEVKRRASGEKRDFQLQVAGRIPEEGPPKLYVIYTDITEQKEREAQLERQNERLDRFASVLSHDLRNPLNVAIGRLELVRDANGAPAETHDHMAAVGRALGRMDQIIEDMLTLTWGGQALKAEDLTACPVAEVAGAAWKNVDTAEAQLSVGDPPTVQASEGRLQRLLENLFRNAVEHAGKTVTVRVGGLPNGGFFVEDDGPGIPEERREQIFDSGYSTREEGTGLGLSIVKTIVETHGWSLSVMEGQEGGARFEVTGIELGDIAEKSGKVESLR